MPTVQHKQTAIGQVWADALMTLAVEAGCEDDLLEELEGLVELLDRQPEFDALLTGPLVADGAKQQLIEEALRGRSSDLLVDALQVLRSKRRLELVRAVTVAFRSAWLDRRDRVEVQVTSAVPLAEELRSALAAAARRRTGREPVVVARVDAGLIGGLVVRIGDDKFDASVASELVRLEHRLLDRGSRELQSGKTYFTESSESS
jgi:F-type H+-transporting ATPase subunit delta